MHAQLARNLRGVVPAAVVHHQVLDIVDTGLNRGAVGLGSALSVIFLVIVLVIALIQRRLIKQEGDVR